MDRKGTFTLICLVLSFVALAMGTPKEEVEPNTPKAEDESNFQSSEGASKGLFTTTQDGRNFVFTIPGLGLGVTIGFPTFFDPTALGGLFPGVIGPIGLGLFGLLLTLGVAAAITLAIVLPIAIGVGIYKKLTGEDETGFSGS